HHPRHAGGDHQQLDPPHRLAGNFPRHRHRAATASPSQRSPVRAPPSSPDAAGGAPAAAASVAEGSAREPAAPAVRETFPTERDPRLRLIIPAVVAVAFLMEQLDSTILVTAVPKMAETLATTPLRMNLAVTAYILTVAMFIPVSGW